MLKILSYAQKTVFLHINDETLALSHLSMPKNCKYIHFNRAAAYPNVGSIRGESSKTSSRPRLIPRIEIRRDRVKNQICCSYRDKGYCRFGSKCRFSHQVSVPPYSKTDSCHDPNVNNNVNVNNFLEEMENVLNTLKDIVEMQHQPTSFSFQHQRVHPRNKPGTTCVASCSDALESKPTSNSLRTKKRKRKVRRGLLKKKGDGSEKSSGTCNFYCANVNGFKSKADSINQIILEHNIDVVLLGNLSKLTRGQEEVVNRQISIQFMSGAE